MSLFQESSPLPGGKAVLLSIKPKYADLILGGTKRAEFRRSWAAQDVSVLVLYSSFPVQKIVGIVEVDDVVIASPTSLWKISSEMGGGLTREELRTYFAGKTRGFAILLGATTRATRPFEPSDVIENFVPPQSFRYLTEKEYGKVEAEVAGKRERA